MSPLFGFQWFIFCFHILSTCSTSQPFDIPRLNSIEPTVVHDHEGKFSQIPPDFKEEFHTQPLDHFNYQPPSYNTFRQRYLVNSKYWGGASNNSPIFVYFGSEAPLDGQMYGAGFVEHIAPQFNALLIYTEHRFYGNSSPAGSQQQAMQDKYLRGYFNSAQALADYAEIIIAIKKKFSAEFSPVIVFGGSYGGMLTSWFRLKYPHVALGALASSAPVRFFPDIIAHDAYYSVVSKDFRGTSQSCFDTIKKSWAEIDYVAQQQGGLQRLINQFKSCKTSATVDDIKYGLAATYRDAAQYDNPPLYPVSLICDGIANATASGTSYILDQIFAGAYAYFYYYKPNATCYINGLPNDKTISQQQQSSYDETREGWGWQACTEMLNPQIHDVNNSMFQPPTYTFNDTLRYCNGYYGVPPRTEWGPTYYGGHHMKLHLNDFGSNIIYSNGLRDPFSSGGVLEDISNTIVAVKTNEGAHCADIARPAQNDPPWLVNQRDTETKIIQQWIDKYYNDLHTIKPFMSTVSKKMEK